jgi:phytoene/squalene synthetase
MSESRARLDFALHLDFGAILKNPVLDIAARLWEDKRYEAFRVCYRSMRTIDDMVDDRKSTGRRISNDEVTALSEQMQVWLGSIRDGSAGDGFASQFTATLQQFDIPFWPWERLRRAMVYDLTHDGFTTFLTFARYAEGAAISPAAIFVHLCGAQATDNGFKRPSYDIRWAARPLALFSYLVHIMRDFETDQRNNLHYYADSILSKCGLVRSDLKEIALTDRPTPPFRLLMGKYHAIAEYYRRQARERVNLVLPHLCPRYQLSLEMVYNLYLQIFERIDPVSGSFTQESLSPTLSELKARIEQTIGQFSPVSTIR